LVESVSSRRILNYELCLKFAESHPSFVGMKLDGNSGGLNGGRGGLNKPQDGIGQEDEEENELL
jgi:hypothetical protein